MIRIALTEYDLMDLRPDLSRKEARQLLDRDGDEIQQAMIAAAWEVFVDKVKTIKAG